MWEIFAENPERGRKFASLMGIVGGTSFAVHNFPWNGLIVDVGGSHGSVMIDVASAYPAVRCIVQDLPEVVEQGAAAMPPQLANQITFMAQFVPSNMISSYRS